MTRIITACLLFLPIVACSGLRSANDWGKPISILKANPVIIKSQPDKGFGITYRWKARPMNKNFRVIVNIVDNTGKVVMNDDHVPPKPTSEWKGRVEYDRIVLLPVWEIVEKSTKAAILPVGEYEIYSGLYDDSTKKYITLDPGNGVKRSQLGLYHIANLKLDPDAPLPEFGEKSLDLTGYKLTFSDDFDDLSVSAYGPISAEGTRWIAHTPWHGDFGDAKFIDPVPGFPFTVENGVLCIEARKVDGEWRSGILSAVDVNGNGFKQQMGYFECRAKFPSGPGVWPAFWLMGTLNKFGGTGPRINPEVDILEHYGHWPNRFTYAFHLWGFSGEKSQHSSQRIPVFGMQDDFHTYGMLIDEQNMILYVDGIERFRSESPEQIKTPLYPLVNLALGPGRPLDMTPDPVRMYVDYIRIYSKNR